METRANTRERISAIPFVVFGGLRGWAAEKGPYATDQPSIPTDGDWLVWHKAIGLETALPAEPSSVTVPATGRRDKQRDDPCTRPGRWRPSLSKRRIGHRLSETRLLGRRCPRRPSLARLDGALGPEPVVNKSTRTPLNHSRSCQRGGSDPHSAVWTIKTGQQRRGLPSRRPCFW